MHRPAAWNVHERGDRARVDAAGETRADRNVTSHPQPHGVAQELADALLDVRLRRLVTRREPPVASPFDPVGRDDRVAVRGQVPDVRKERRLARVRGMAVEEAGDLLFVGRTLLREGCEDRLRLGGEADPLAAHGVAERLDPEAVAGEDEAPATAVPEPERPHAVEMLEAIRAPLGVRVEDDLRVGLGAELRPLSLELAPQLDIVVDLAVEGEPQIAVGQAHRLVSGRGRVDDGEPLVRQPELAVAVDAAAVRSAVTEDRRHPFER